MLKDCNYNKVKLIHDISRILNFINKHAIPDAEAENHPLCVEMHKELAADLEKHLAKLSEAVKGLSKEEKFE